NRYYKEKRCPFEVIEYIEKEHLGTLDHRITSTFLRNIASYYIGEHARLSSGETGEIVYINPYNISKPIVKCADRYIDLSTDSKIRITEMS
ncbi:MAG TPA: HD-GYP domain-containing protein, partial [Clostridiales bacterium]|nr:HD-GYP domain-containing protein [Clostridiales bacterium]